MKSIIKILILLSLISCQQNELDKERIIGIGKKLTQTEFTQMDSKQISDIIIVGNGLREKMTELQKNTTEFEFQTKEGDFDEPFGDNQADAILIIKTDYKNIGIRLQYDKVKNKYHILGWKTLDNF
ncbi:hypothetical protein [uncultured Aquimarina sp.]|uniref:hypothetical protein n=1 Tax=uncultured Aquimarina sp. TaxID=575652 RepID=UPI00260ADF56|nr:hypothetical protein [uncultured Aquimarina sp.]